jgi:hypothetical protein
MRKACSVARPERAISLRQRDAWRRKPTFAGREVQRLGCRVMSGIARIGQWRQERTKLDHDALISLVRAASKFAIPQKHGTRRQSVLKPPPHASIAGVVTQVSEVDLSGREGAYHRTARAGEVEDQRLAGALTQAQAQFNPSCPH